MKLLAIDLSTSATGWALLDSDTHKLLQYGVIVPDGKGMSKMKYPEKAFHQVEKMSDQVAAKVKELAPDEIVVEEVNRSLNRIGQKSLDAVHFFLMSKIKTNDPEVFKKLNYLDSNGSNGWRPTLEIKLSDMDKAINKALRKKDKKAAVINWKTLAVRYVNLNYGLGFTIENDPGKDGDICDAICLGTAWLKLSKI